MKRLSAIFALAIGVLLNALPAGAATSFIQDGANMFSPGTVSQLNGEIANFNAQTNKQIVVVTVPSLGGETLQDAAQKVFSEQQVNGILIFIAKDDRKDIIVPGRATAAFFPPETLRSIRQSMEAQFKNEDFDGGITTAVNSTLDIFRAHLQSAPSARGATSYNYPATTRGGYAQRYNSGVHISMFWWILIIVVGFLIIRSIMRAASGPRSYGGPVGPGGAPMGGPGYGPGYGGGYGPGYYGGGGGGFWSGLLGGLGGAFLGNELFGNRGGNTYIEQQPGGVTPADQGGGWGGGADQSGWGSDAGQADMGGASSGDWSGGGFGDSGGGGGDFGGGGGDSGGGW